MINTTDYTKLNYRPPKPPEPSPAEQAPPDWGIIVKSYTWMIAALQLAHNNTGLNVGTYSPKLLEAMGQKDNLLDWMKANEQETEHAILPR